MFSFSTLECVRIFIVNSGEFQALESCEIFLDFGLPNPFGLWYNVFVRNI